MSDDRTDREPRDGDLLTPWRATGRLSRDDAAAFERMLADDPDLARGLAAAEGERDETVALNEALATPSRASLDRLFQRIEAHEARRAPQAAGIARWFSEKLAGLSPTTLTWGAAAAALLIAVQAGFLTRAYLSGGEGTYEMASAGPEAALGATALVAFQPTATADQIAALLRDVKAEIVGGPKPGGVFVVRLGDEALEAALKRLRANTTVVKFATPGG